LASLEGNFYRQRDFYSCGQALSRFGVTIVCRSIRLNAAQLPRGTRVHHRFRSYVLLRASRPFSIYVSLICSVQSCVSRVVISHRPNVARITAIIAM